MSLASAVRVATPVGYAIPLDGVLRLTLYPTEVAPLLGLTERQVREMCRAGLLRSRNLHPGSRNGRYLIPVEAIIDYLAGSDDPIAPLPGG